jgi:putative transposase
MATSPRPNRHGSVHLFGAICPARGIGAAIIMPVVNSEATNHHLKEISTQVAANAHALLICDGDGWHRPSAKLIVPDIITLMSLPPYARNSTRWRICGITCATIN